MTVELVPWTGLSPMLPTRRTLIVASTTGTVLLVAGLVIGLMTGLTLGSNTASGAESVSGGGRILSRELPEADLLAAAGVAPKPLWGTGPLDRTHPLQDVGPIATPGLMSVSAWGASVRPTLAPIEQVALDRWLAAPDSEGATLELAAAVVRDGAPARATLEAVVALMSATPPAGSSGVAGPGVPAPVASVSPLPPAVAEPVERMSRN